jgi:hypothetical protein
MGGSKKGELTTDISSHCRKIFLDMNLKKMKPLIGFCDKPNDAKKSSFNAFLKALFKKGAPQYF